MRSRTEQLEDNWFGVQDARKRKQIQDRLAQRAHRLRKRLADSTSVADKDGITEVPNPPAQLCMWDEGQLGCADFTVHQDIAMLQYPSPANSPVSEHGQAVDRSPGLVLSCDHSLIPRGSISVYTALFNNGVILGIPCSCTAASKSRVQGPRIPLSLQPIPLQLETVHYELIDRFPFPRMRYNMISLFDLYNIEDFVADLFTTSTFTLKPGGESWDPRAWRVDTDFKAKWGFLLTSI